MSSILLLEDDAALRETIAKLLRKRGYDVTCAPSGSEAVEAASQQSFDLIITDIRMEGIDGLEALERVKQNQPDISSLVMTGYSTEEDSIRAIRLGVGEYLKKPFRLPTLLDSVGQILSRRKTQASGQLLSYTLLGLLEVVCQNATWSEACRAAERAADSLGLEEEEALWLQTAVLCRGLTDSGRQLPTLPDRLQSTIDGASQPWREVTQSSRVVAAVLQLHSNSDFYDPQVLKALLGPQQQKKPRGRKRRLRSLFTLAKALMARGETEFAREALTTVCKESGLGRLQLEALFCLAEIAAEGGQSAQSLEHYEKALAESNRVGPRIRAQFHLRAGVSLGPEQRERAQSCLELAEQLAEEVKDKLLLEQARLSLLGLNFRDGQVEPHIETLKKLSNPVELSECLIWLLPLLLQELDEYKSSVLVAWARQFPDLFDRLILANKHGKTVLMNALEICRSAGVRLSEAAIQSLQSQDSALLGEALSQLSKVTSESQSSALSICSFGPFRIMGGSEQAQVWKTQKVRYLLAYLAAHSGKCCTDDELIEAFWPQAEPAKGKKSLNTNLSFLRSHLKKHYGLENVIHRDVEGTRLPKDALAWHDLDEVRNLVREASKQAKSGSDELELTLRKILDLQSGEFLEGCYFEWATVIKRQTETYAREAGRKLTQIYDRKKRPVDALEAGLRALELDPCQEDVAECVVRSYAALGHRQDLVRFFRNFKQALWSELELEPSEELTSLVATVSGHE